MTGDVAPPTERRRRRRTRRGVPRYEVNRYLCSDSEWRFRAALEQAVGEHFDIMFQVRVASILRPRSAARWITHGRRISQKSFDFVLLRKGTSRVVAAIELDDRSHELPERKLRDRFLEQACQRARFPLIRFRVAREYDPEQVREELLEKTQINVRRRR